MLEKHVEIKKSSCQKEKWKGYLSFDLLTMSLFHVQLTIELRFKNVGVTTGCLKKCDPSSSTITHNSTPSNIEKQIAGVFFEYSGYFLHNVKGHFQN